MSDQEITGVNVTGVPLESSEGDLMDDPVEELLLRMQRLAREKPYVETDEPPAGGPFVDHLAT